MGINYVIISLYHCYIIHQILFRHSRTTSDATEILSRQALSSLILALIKVCTWVWIVNKARTSDPSVYNVFITWNDKNKRQRETGFSNFCKILAKIRISRVDFEINGNDRTWNSALNEVSHRIASEYLQNK